MSYHKGYYNLREPKKINLSTLEEDSYKFMLKLDKSHHAFVRELLSDKSLDPNAIYEKYGMSFSEQFNRMMMVQKLS